MRTDVLMFGTVCLTSSLHLVHRTGFHLAYKPWGKRPAHIATRCSLLILNCWAFVLSLKLLLIVIYFLR